MEKHYRLPWQVHTGGPALRPSERRAAHRYPVVEEKARLGWWEGRDFRDFGIKLLDVSHDGLLAVADVPLLEEQDVWVRLERAAQSEWAAVSVVGDEDALVGPHNVRLKFHGPCPYAFFKAAILGAEALTSSLAPPSAWGDVGGN